MKFGRIALGISILASLVVAAEPPIQVPKPYTPVEASADRFGCLGRSTEIGSLLLPTQITAADKALLAGPVRLKADPDFFAGLQSCATVESRQPDSAQWNWDADSADVHINSTMTGDCDGFCWYEIRLTPKHPLTVRSLVLELPRTLATARYLHTANFTWSNISRGIPELGGKWSSVFWPYIWIGDEQRGLAWSAESTQGWLLHDPKRALSIETQGNIILFRVAFIDHQVTLSKPLALRWGLQASPLKPISFAWRAGFRVVHDIHYESCLPGANGRCELDDLRDGGAKTAIIHDSWTAYFGQTAPADKVKFRRLINACHERGLKLLVYVGYGLARTAPEMQGHHDQWSVLPLVPWDPSYKPQTRGFDASCPRSGWADWLVAGIDKLFTDYNIDGLYLDSTSETFPCNNTEHGCGWKDEQGNIQPVYPMLSTRRLMRRIADTVHRHNPDAILDAHMSGNMTLQTLAFCDSAWDGEQFNGHAPTENFAIPLDTFRTEFMGYAHGLDTEFLCYENRPFTFDEAIALAWVHGVEVRPYPQTLAKVTPLWRAMDHFGIAHAVWHPYWSQPVASVDNADTKISAWVRNQHALLFISHLQRTQADVHVRLDLDALHFKSDPLHATDALSGKAIPLDGQTIPLSFKAMRYRMVEIGP